MKSSPDYTVSLRQKRIDAASEVRPWLFVPVLYVMQAIPATLAREVSTLVYENFGVPNARIALWVSLLGFLRRDEGQERPQSIFARNPL